MRVSVGKNSAQQHFVRAQADAGYQVVGFERSLLNLGVIVGGVAVQCQLAYGDQRVIAMRPNLGEVEGVEAILLGFGKWHDLHVKGPAGVIALLEGFVKVAGVIVRILSGQLVGFLWGKALNALVSFEVVFKWTWAKKWNNASQSNR